MGKIEELKARKLYIKETFIKYLTATNQDERLKKFNEDFGKGSPKSTQRYLNHLIDSANDEQAAFNALSKFDKMIDVDKTQLDIAKSTQNKLVNTWVAEDREAKKAIKEAAGETKKEKTKAQITAEAKLQKGILAASEEEQKKFLHLENDLKTLENRFNKYALIYQQTEIDEFKSKLTKFQTGIDNKIKELKENKIKAEKEAALKEFNDIKQALVNKATKLRELNFKFDNNGNPII